MLCAACREKAIQRARGSYRAQLLSFLACFIFLDGGDNAPTFCRDAPRPISPIPSVWFLNNSSNIRGIFSLDPLENALPIASLSQQTPFEQTKRLNASIYPLRKDGIRTC